MCWIALNKPFVCLRPDLMKINWRTKRSNLLGLPLIHRIASCCFRPDTNKPMNKFEWNNPMKIEWDHIDYHHHIRSFHECQSSPIDDEKSEYYWWRLCILTNDVLDLKRELISNGCSQEIQLPFGQSNFRSSMWFDWTSGVLLNRMMSKYERWTFSGSRSICNAKERLE